MTEQAISAGLPKAYDKLHHVDLDLCRHDFGRNFNDITAPRLALSDHIWSSPAIPKQVPSKRDSVCHRFCIFFQPVSKCSIEGAFDWTYFAAVDRLSRFFSGFKLFESLVQIEALRSPTDLFGLENLKVVECSKYFCESYCRHFFRKQFPKLRVAKSLPVGKQLRDCLSPDALKNAWTFHDACLRIGHRADVPCKRKRHCFFDYAAPGCTPVKQATEKIATNIVDFRIVWFDVDPSATVSTSGSMKYPPHSDVRAIFIEQLRSVRIESGVSQTELGARLGIQQSDVSKVERGVRRLDVVELRAWLAALSVPLLEFVRCLDAELSSRESLGKTWKHKMVPKNRGTKST